MKYITQRAAVNRDKDLVVLPDFIADPDVSRATFFQPGQRAQKGGFSTARRPEQCGDSRPGRRQFGIQQESTPAQPEARLDRHDATNLKRRFAA